MDKINNLASDTTLTTVVYSDEPDSLPTCTHGSPVRSVTVVDHLRKSEVDPYGDIEGPVSVAMLADMKTGRDLEIRHTRDRSRFALGLLHADRCRTEL
ncbi:hypothetical protein [Spirillospora sp. CA-294931]|uniref:hypothetical protein n=1 Tax=Spirillospora sp. CA-294931 TaxID=3240042 RepID=UPI003D91D01A